MKSIFVILVVSLLAYSEARYFKVAYDQQPWASNPNAAYSSRIVNGEPGKKKLWIFVNESKCLGSAAIHNQTNFDHV